MQSGLDPFTAPSSLTSRRSAASSLPNFELPPPSLAGFHGKYQSYGSGSNPQSQTQSVSLASMGSLLTPPNSNTHGGDLLSFGSSSSTNNMAQPTASSSSYSSASSYWPPPSQQNGQYTYGGGALGQWIPPRGLFSPPSLNSLGRTGSNNSSTAVDGSSQQQGSSYDTSVQLPPFSASSMPMSPPLPGLSSNGQHAGMYTNQNTNTSNSALSPHSPVSNHDSFGIRPSPTSTYFNQSQPPSNNFSYPLPSPSIATSNQPQRLPVTSPAEMSTLQQTTSQLPNQYSRPYSNFSLPAMNNPIMSGLHGSGSPMSLVGGVPPNGMINGYSYVPRGGSTQHMYLSGPPSQVQGPSDRPFKCDQCVQSFSRNHDLKRHKRIHLAVKPYPCQHCDKSFSRKDALKRHILVKGCGKVQETTASDGSDSSVSPTTTRLDAAFDFRNTR